MRIIELLQNATDQVAETMHDPAINHDWRVIKESLESIAARLGEDVSTVECVIYDARKEIKSLWEALNPIYEHINLPWWRRLFHKAG